MDRETELRTRLVSAGRDQRRSFWEAPDNLQLSNGDEKCRDIQSRQSRRCKNIALMARPRKGFCQATRQSRSA